MTITADTVADSGFFCRMSAKGSDGWRRKLHWLGARFAEGLQIRMLGGDERGFIEFIPGRYAWRAIEGADDFLVIHCLWVVGESRRKGFGSLLLDAVEDHARAGGYRGVAAVTSGGGWLIDSPILEKRGYVSVDGAAPRFDLLVKKFDRRISAPRFCGEFERKRSAYDGLVVYRSDQCPYLADATRTARHVAATRGLPFREIELDSAAAVRERAPTPYGTFAIVLNGRLVSYHHLTERQFPEAVAA